MNHDYTGGTVPTWQQKIVRRLEPLSPGRYLLTFEVPVGGTVEPTWTVLELGKVENSR